ncbi:MAG: hypothetical protein LBQ88_12930 [Treponema sp.]|nr:hypothetical protein [Treponema sp.]
MNAPIIMGVEGEARDIVLDAKAGEIMEPENEHELLLAIDRIKKNGRDHYQGRDYVTRKYNRDTLAGEMLE